MTAVQDDYPAHQLSAGSIYSAAGVVHDSGDEPKTHTLGDMTLIGAIEVWLKDMKKGGKSEIFVKPDFSPYVGRCPCSCLHLRVLAKSGVAIVTGLTARRSRSNVWWSS